MEVMIKATQCYSVNTGLVCPPKGYVFEAPSPGVGEEKGHIL